MFFHFYKLLFLLACIKLAKSDDVEYFKAIHLFDAIKIAEALQEFSETPACIRDLKNFLSGLNRTEVWALTMFDSSAKVPDGLLAGNFAFLGHYDECLKVQHPDGNFIGQHCMIDASVTIPQDVIAPIPEMQPLALKANMKANNATQGISLPIFYGICLPSTCTPLEINLGFKSLLNKTGIPEEIVNVTLDPGNCNTKEGKPIADSDWAVIGVLIAFGVVAALSTIYDIFKQFYRKKDKPHPLLTSFSIYSNGREIFHISEANKELKCLNGIRVFSMCWVVICHTYSFTLAGPVVNLLDINKVIEDVNHVLIINGYVAVDTFFFLSGLLVCFVFFRDISKRKYYDVPLSYIHRYIRITPPFAMIMLIQATIFTYFGSGPYWNYLSELAADPCRKYWWSGVLYVENWATPDLQCLGQSWYLTVDMQLYWLSPLVLYFLLFLPALAPFYLLLLVLAVACTNFAVAYVHDLGPNLFITNNPRQAQIEYFHFYTRAVPWLTGVAVGYLICGIQTKKIKIELSKLWILIGWLICTGLCLASLYGIVPFTDHDYTTLEASFYLAFHRIAWSLGIAWIVFACSQGYGGPINAFLSWNVFQPLAKLTFCTFLIHMTVMFYRGATVRSNLYAGDVEMTYYFLGDVVLAYLLAIPFTLLFEIPFGNIYKYFFQNVKIFPFPRPKKGKGSKSQDDNNNLKVITGEEPNSSKRMD